MKKVIIILIYSAIFLSMNACSNIDGSRIIYPESGITNYTEIPSGPYAERMADWPIYKNTGELVDAADIVLIGKVRSVEFKVLDCTNALHISDETPDYAKELYTIYNIDVLTIYKGNASQSISVRVMGGMVEYNIDQQLKIMEENQAFNRERGIPIWDEYYKVQCEVGKSYLFALCQFETGLPTILNLAQSVYNLDEPTRKNTIGNNTVVYYSGNVDDYGLPLISALDIITSFGSKCTDTFEKNWENGLYK